MTLAHVHDLHRRRLGRNLGLGAALLLFVALVFGLTLVKVGQGDRMHAYDAPGAARAVAGGQP